jgi:hypothetical protein
MVVWGGILKFKILHENGDNPVLQFLSGHNLVKLK